MVSQAEIVDHYNNGAGKYYASSTDTPAVAQDSASDFKPVSYQLPNTTNLGPAGSPLQQTSTIASFIYDGDGRQVKAVVGSTTTYYIGSHYQIDNGVVTKYYFAGAQRVAMRKNGTLSYLLSDHLGSTSITTNTSGAVVAELRYCEASLWDKAWGETRYSSGTTPTSYRYTGQREEPSFGLYFYNARWYDPYITQFSQPDSIIPDPNNPQDWNRYAYARNNPLRYTDPSGHKACLNDKECRELGITPNGKDYLDFTGYSLWEGKVLRRLYDRGGLEGRHAVDYIIQHDVHFVFSQETQPAAWHPLKNDIFLDSDEYSEQSNPNDPYMLSLIAHEAVHLEQTMLKAITLAGEIEAWQVGFAVYNTMTGQLPSGFNPLAASNIMSLDAHNMGATDLQNARVWMKDFDPKYRSQLLYPWSLEFIWDTYDFPNPSEICWDFCWP